MNDEAILTQLSTVYQVLQTELNDRITKTHYRYVLFDRLGVVSELSPLYNDALQDTVAPELLAVIKRPELAHNLDSCPLLVCLAEPGEPLNATLLLASLAQIKHDHLTRKHYVCGFITSPLPPEALAGELLESCLRAGRALGSAFLPFYEPFTLDVLYHSYDAPASHLGTLLPADTRYCFVDSDIEAHVFHAMSYLDESDFTLRFVNQTLRYHLLNQMTLYGLVVTWHDLCEAQDKPLVPHLLSTIIGYFYDSQATQLVNPRDRRAYVLFSLQYGQLTASKRLSYCIDEVINHEDKQGLLGELLSQERQALEALTNNQQ
ncbi:hypothetical protein RHO14_07425 [Orbus wheelerorum]|uniref:hypothetical protein n=1 Tax=Orbus wheelerorum TaxID=3074111 RepID=UPI00370D8BB1